MSHRILIALIALLALPSLALAETLGGAGSIHELEVNSIHADTYLQYHGRLVVAEGKNSFTEYRWGGASCGTRVLDDAQVAGLQRAMGAGLKVAPRFKDGQGGSKCVVGYIVVDQ